MYGLVSLHRHILQHEYPGYMLVMRKGRPNKTATVKTMTRPWRASHLQAPPAVLLECLLGAAGVVHSDASLPLLQCVCVCVAFTVKTMLH